MSVILTNHSGSICHVYGYPGLAFFDGLPMATHLTWVKESHATVVHPGAASRPAGPPAAPRHDGSHW
jgi:hypothetical protein